MLRRSCHTLTLIGSLVSATVLLLGTASPALAYWHGGFFIGIAPPVFVAPPPVFFPAAGLLRAAAGGVRAATDPALVCATALPTGRPDEQRAILLRRNLCLPDGDGRRDRHHLLVPGQ